MDGCNSHNGSSTMWTGRRLASILPFPAKIHVKSSRPVIMSVCVLAYATLKCLKIFDIA